MRTRAYQHPAIYGVGHHGGGGPRAFQLHDLVQPLRAKTETATSLMVLHASWEVSARMSTVVARDYGSLRGGYAAAAALTTAYCMTEIAQQPPLRGCPPMVAADDCMDSLDFCACISWLDHSTGADHRSRAFQLTPSVALSLSLSLRATSRRRGGVMVRAGMNAKSYQF